MAKKRSKKQEDDDVDSLGRKKRPRKYSGRKLLICMLPEDWAALDVIIESVTARQGRCSQSDAARLAIRRRAEEIVMDQRLGKTAT